jgi:hypothetical protein
MALAKKIIYITKADYDTLYANGAKTGSITKNGTTYTYDENADYRVSLGTELPLTPTTGYTQAAANTQFWSKDNTGTVLYNANVATVNNVPTLTLKTKQKNATTGDVTDGTDVTFTDTHYITTMFAGNSTAKENAATSNPYVKLFDDATLRSAIQILGSSTTGIQVNSDATGKITVQADTTFLATRGYLEQYTYDNFVKYNDVMMNTNPFGGKKLYINSIDDAFFAADRKWYVTASLHLITYNGETYPKLNSAYQATYATTTTDNITYTVTNSPSDITVFNGSTLCVK